jgi:hypothetical protein
VNADERAEVARQVGEAREHVRVVRGGVSAQEWLRFARKRDRLLVWQRDDPLDLPLPRNVEARAEILAALDAEFSR